MAQKASKEEFVDSDAYGGLPYEAAGYSSQSVPIVETPVSQKESPVAGLPSIGSQTSAADAEYSKNAARLQDLARFQWASQHPENPKPDENGLQFQEFLGNLQFGQEMNPDAFKTLLGMSDEEYARLSPVRENLSKLLSENKFPEAIRYAQQNNAQVLLEDPVQFQAMRKPFTREEASAFLNSVPSDYFQNSPYAAANNGSFRYDPNNALKYFDSSGGYPGLTGGYTRNESDFGNIMNAAVIGGIGLAAGTALAPLLGLGGGAATGAAEAAATAGQTVVGGLSGIPSAALNAAAKSAIGNAVVTAVQGGDLGDVLKAAAQGAITGGAGAAVASTFAPALQGALVDAGIDPSIAKAASTAAISAGQAAVAGQDPLQAAFISGLGTYAQLQGNQVINDFAESTGISTELAKQLVGPAGAAVASSIVGGDALHAALNQLVNQNYDKITDYAEQKLTDILPEGAVQGIKDIKGQIDSFLQQGKEALGSVVSNLGQPSIDDLQDVTVSATRLPVTPVNLIQQPSGSSSAAVTPEPAGGLTQTVEPPTPPETVEVTAGREQGPPIVLSPPSGSGEPAGGLTAEAQPEPPETVEVTGKKEPDVPVLSGGLTSNEPPVVDTSALDTVNVTAKKEPEVPANVLPVGNQPTVGADGLEEVTVSTSPYTQPPINLALNDFTPTVEQPDVGFQPPFNLNIETGKGGGLGSVASGAAPEQFPWLDTSDQFLKAKPTTAQGAKLAQLQQIFSQLDPSLQGVLADKGYTPAAMGGSIRSYAEGSSVTCCFKAVLKDMAPNFVPCSQETLAPLSPRKVGPLSLAKLIQMKPYIAPTGGVGGMAQGGLPSKYAEATPKGHNPEFITGLTGYYAQGGGTGQSDDIPAMLHDGDYVMDADTVAAFGDGSSKAGAQVMEHLRKQVPHQDGGQGKAVPAKIADGEYVFPASFVTALGGGDNKRGAKMLDLMRERLRAHKRSAPTSKIPPKAKSPLDYLRKG